MSTRPRPESERTVRGPLQSFDLEAGPETLLACDAGVRHAVEAIDDAACLVSVATGGAG